jgi:hypothetical protein
VYFAHTMAGGIPKAKVFLAIANRIYKGRGERFMSSRALLDSDLGKLILMNFDEVSANTLQHLIDGSAAIRARIEPTGGQVRYSAYGYHGTEILIDGKYQWQTYSNYTQGLPRCAWKTWPRPPGKRHQGHRLQLPGNPHQLVRHLRRRRTAAVPLLDALKKKAAAPGPKSSGRSARACWKTACRCKTCSTASPPTTATRPACNSATSPPGRWTTRRNWPKDRHLGRHHQAAQGPQGPHHRPPELAGAGRHGPADVPHHVGTASARLWLNHDIIARQLNSVHN